jgi:hypothetical protein
MNDELFLPIYKNPLISHWQRHFSQASKISIHLSLLNLTLTAVRMSSYHPLPIFHVASFQNIFPPTLVTNLFSSLPRYIFRSSSKVIDFYYSEKLSL